MLMKRPTGSFFKSRKYKKLTSILLTVLLLLTFCVTPALAAGKGDVAGAIEETWKEGLKQVKAVCDKVIFPLLTLVLGVLFFVKLATAYFDFRKHGQFEWLAPALLFAGLVVTIVAPKFIWGIVGV